MTYTPEQLNELADRLDSILPFAEDQVSHTVYSSQLRAHADALEENARLRRELAAERERADRNEEDAERYRHLKKNCRYGFDETSPTEPQLVHATETGPHENPRWRQDLDAAIDAARGKP